MTTDQRNKTIEQLVMIAHHCKRFKTRRTRSERPEKLVLSERSVLPERFFSLCFDESFFVSVSSKIGSERSGVIDRLVLQTVGEVQPESLERERFRQRHGKNVEVELNKSSS